MFQMHELHETFNMGTDEIEDLIQEAETEEEERAKRLKEEEEEEEFWLEQDIEKKLRADDYFEELRHHLNGEVE